MLFYKKKKKNLNGLENKWSCLVIIQPFLALVIFFVSLYYSITDIISRCIFSLIFCIPESLVYYSSESKVLTLTNVLCLFIALSPDGQVTLFWTWRCLNVHHQLLDARYLYALQIAVNVADVSIFTQFISFFFYHMRAASDTKLW